MSLLTAEQILAAQDLPHEDVEVKEWGGTVRVQALSGLEREAFELASRDHRAVHAETPNNRAMLVAHSVRDESGARLFSDAQIEELGRRSGVVLDRLFDVAARLSLLSEKSVEAAEKNS